MSSDDGRSNDGRSDDPDVQEFMDEVEQHSRAIYEMVSDYMDDLEVPEAIISHVLLSLSFNMRMVAYVVDTEKPSATGLRLDLDRMRSEIEQILREVQEGRRGFHQGSQDGHCRGRERERGRGGLVRGDA